MKISAFIDFMKALEKIRKKKKQVQHEDNFLLEGTIGNMDLISPDGVLEYDDYIKLSYDKFVRIFSVLEFSHEDYVGYFDYIYSEFGEDIDSVDIIEPVTNNSRAIDVLTKEISIVKSNEIRKGNSGEDFDQGALQVIEDLDNLRKRIQVGKERLFYVRKIFRIWGKTKEELDTNCRRFKEKCDERSIIAKVLLMNQSEGYKSTMPTPYIGSIPNKFKKNFSAMSLAGVLPEGLTDFNHPNGIPLGNILKTNAPFKYDSFIGSPMLPNPMALILGNSGAGKSVLMKLILSRGSAMGEWSIGFDLEGELEKMVGWIGAEYIDIRAGEKTGINPLDLEIEEYQGRKFIDIAGKVTEIRELLNMFSEKFNSKPLTGKEITRIEEVVRELYSSRGIKTNDPNSIYQDSGAETEDGYMLTKAKKKMPILSDVKNELEKYDETKDLALIMKMITGEGSLAIFDCETRIELKARRNIIFGLRNITDNFTKFFSLMNIMTFLWAKLSRDEFKDIKKRVPIDEGWYFTQYEHISSMLESLDRRGRKYRISMVIGSQLIEEFVSSKSGKVILSIAETKFILRQSEVSAKELIKQLGLPQSYSGYLQNFDPGQAIVMSGNKKVAVKIKYYEFEREFVET